MFHGPAREYSAGEDVWGKHLRPLGNILRSMATGGERAYYLNSLLEWLRESAQGQERDVVDAAVTVEVIKDLGDSSQRARVSAAQRLLAAPISDLAAKHRVEMFFGSED